MQWFDPRHDQDESVNEAFYDLMDQQTFWAEGQKMKWYFAQYNYYQL